MDDQNYENQDLVSDPLTPEESASDGPRPQDFDDYDLFVSARIDHGIAKATKDLAGRSTGDLKQGLVEALTEDRQARAKAHAEAMANRPENSLPDDELVGPRQDALDWISECKQKEEEARLRGDPKQVHAWKQRAQWGVQDIKKLGKSKVEIAVEDLESQFEFQSVEQLFHKETVNDPMWNAPKMLHDAGIVVSRQNSRNRSGVVALPLELVPNGDILPCHPKNIVQVSMPPEVFERFKASVYQSGAANVPDEVFRRSWQALRRLGYAETAVRAHDVAKKAKGETETDPNKMTFKEFCLWREASEEKKRAGRPRKGFVFPKTNPRRHG